MGSLRDLRRNKAKRRHRLLNGNIEDVFKALAATLDVQNLCPSPPYTVAFDIEAGGLTSNDISVWIEWDH
jgi:hypothetical protein